MMKTKKICFNQNCFQAEIADNDASREKGLMYRKNLIQDRGMIFNFSKEGKYLIWMKDTKIPLDVIWLNNGYKIVDIQTLVPCDSDPCPTFAPAANAQFILEINAGLAEKFNIKIGDKAEFAK